MFAGAYEPLCGGKTIFNSRFNQFYCPLNGSCPFALILIDFCIFVFMFLIQLFVYFGCSYFILFVSSFRGPLDQ